jgi:hypothetical protein
MKIRKSVLSFERTWIKIIHKFFSLDVSDLKKNIQILFL